MKPVSAVHRSYENLGDPLVLALACILVGCRGPSRDSVCMSVPNSLSPETNTHTFYLLHGSCGIGFRASFTCGQQMASFKQSTSTCRSNQCKHTEVSRSQQQNPFVRCTTSIPHDVGIPVSCTCIRSHTRPESIGVEGT